MFSLVNFARTLLAKIIALLYTIVSVLFNGTAVKTELPKCPDDFTPVVRFAVCSDVHLNGDPNQVEAERLKKLFDTVYAYSETQDYKNFDAIAFAGDIATSGNPAEYDVLNDIINEKVKEGTKVLTCLGNHEFIAYRDYDASIGTRVFEEKMQRKDCEHAVINGYHFIISSYDEDGHSFIKKSQWINSEIKKAVKDTGDKPVFVFQHPAPFATIYGSVIWGDPILPLVYMNYPQVVDFSGHSHYPINDPRSIWQGGYTALGCGTLSSFETELDGFSGNFPYNCDEAAQFYIVEADKDGNVHILPYDLITEQFFNNDYYLTDLANKNYEYTYEKMKLRDESPVFSKDTAVSTYKNDAGETILKFDGAKDNFIVESYKVSVTKGLKLVARDNFTSKYLYLFMEDNYEVNLGVLEEGAKYTAEITALNAFAKTSKPFIYSFVAE